ncbi:MAG TPA: penicillin-binding protein 2 [Elusimicrobiota bacterium]|jgi:cell division protein FtsI (penicillin-binding protein 3)|nr:penicillin-binding protein 2 [Elusimicrobiota bacterium]
MDLGLRLTVAAGLALAPLPLLGLRLADLQVLRHGALETRAAGEFERVSEEAAPRADILDRDGRVLARSVPTWSSFADKAMVKNPAAFAARLAPLLGVPARELAARVRDANRFAWLKTGMTAEQSDALRAARVDGVGIVPVEQRVYPNGDLARGVLGLVGTEGKGLAGAELTLDKRLRGAPRRFELIRDGAGHSIYQSIADDGRIPDPIRLTIDRNVQFLAEEALRDAAGKNAFKSGFAVVQDPNTGEFLAMASWPPSPLKNPLVQDAYEPGSVFKIVTALSALDGGLIRPGETFYGEHGRYEVSPGVFITDHEAEGDMTLAQILAKSSNIGISKVVQLVGAERFYRMCRVFGFGAKTGVPLPGETAGELRPLSELTKVGLASSSYGYNLQVSAVQTVTAYSAIANGGTLWEPKLVLDGRPPVEVRRIGSEGAVRALSAMLEGVVEDGTGESARIPGYRVAGKTGTAHKVDPLTHRYSPTEYTASFIGYLPASAPRWTILVVINDPKGAYYGAEAAAPIFSRIAKRLLVLDGVAPDQPADAALATARR